MKIATLITAALLTISTAHAQPVNIGDTISLPQPTVGCKDFKLAYEAFRLRTLHGPAASEMFAREHGVQGEPDARYCTMLGATWQGAPDPDEKYEIMRKHRTQYTAPSDAWLCVIAEPIALGPNHDSEAVKRQAKERDCFWMFARGSNRP